MKAEDKLKYLERYNTRLGKFGDDPKSLRPAVLLVALNHLLLSCGIRAYQELAADRRHTPFGLGYMVWLVIVFFPAGFQPCTYFQF